MGGQTLNHDEIKSAVREAIEEYKTDFWVDAEQHYLHHKLMEECQQKQPEWKANHKFVSDVRKSGGIAKSVAIKVIITAILGYIGVVLFGKVL